MRDRVTSMLRSTVVFLASMLLRLCNQKIRYIILQNVMKYFNIIAVRSICGECIVEGDSRDRLFMDCVVRSNEFEKGTVDLLVKYFTQYDQGTFIDVGANIGLITAPIAKIGHVKCICFEPDPNNYSYLARNVEINAKGNNVELHRIALANKSGVVRLEINNENHGLHRISSLGEIASYPSGLKLLEVRAERLDSILNSQNLLHPIVVKMDIQGSEFLAIEGGRKLLSVVDMFIMEYEPDSLIQLGVNLVAFRATLKDMFPYGAIIDSEKIVDKHFRMQPIELINSKLSQVRSGHVDIVLSYRQKLFCGMTDEVNRSNATR